MLDSGLLDNSFYRSDLSDEDLKDMDEEMQMLFQCVVAQVICIICSMLMNGRMVANNQ